MSLHAIWSGQSETRIVPIECQRLTVRIFSVRSDGVVPVASCGDVINTQTTITKLRHTVEDSGIL
jgi:hypothetical protein